MSRQTFALAAMVVAVVFTGKALGVLGTEPEVLGGIATVLILVGAVAGALYHPIRRFWWRGALAGVVTTMSTFVVTEGYSRLRPHAWQAEFAPVFLVGALPGIALYALLMRGQFLEPLDAGRSPDSR